jgi:hypothetical protein
VQCEQTKNVRRRAKRQEKAMFSSQISKWHQPIEACSGRQWLEEQGVEILVAGFNA